MMSGLITGAVRRLVVQLAAAQGASLIGFMPAGVGAILRTVLDKLLERVSVFDFMTAAQRNDVKAGTALLDVTAACQAALNASKCVEFPHPGKYKTSAPLVPQNGATVIGGGKSPVYPYDAPTYTGSFGTEILVTNFAAFDLTNSVAVRIKGFGMKAAAGGVSVYGAAANYVAGAVGVALTGSTLCEVSDVSFHGLEYGVSASPVADAGTAAFWRLNNYTAQDCKTVVKVGNAASATYIARDFSVSDCTIALHCNQMIDINWADGARIELARFFQAYGVSVLVKNTPFLAMIGVTAFESKGDNIVIDTCQYAVLSGVTSSRAGGYTAATPWPSARGISVINCPGAVVNGIIEHPSECGLYISGSSNVKADVAIVEPFYTNGMLSAGVVLGAVTVLASSNVNVDITASGTGYLYALASDYASAQSIVGKVGGDIFTGVYRGFNLASPDFAMVAELAADLALGAGGSAIVARKRIWVPAGKSLVTRAFHMTSPGVTLRIAGAFWTGGLTAEADGGNTSFEKKVIFTQGGAGGFYAVDVQLYAPGGAVTVPGGHKTMISFAIE